MLTRALLPAMDSISVARAAVAALESKQRVGIPGLSNQFLALLPRFLPRALICGDRQKRAVPQCVSADSSNSKIVTVLTPRRATRDLE